MLELFKYDYPKNNQQKETTEIEYIQFEFSSEEKKEVIYILEKYCQKKSINNYSDGILKILRELENE
tara:strand:- start:5649 stop:5849 length:201 start_codon:yes stop_codon:yes gene_type:complete